jgi:hypothetical protein
MVRPDTRCPPSTHAARDWAKGARRVIHLSNVLSSSPQRTDPSPKEESRVPGFLRSQLQVWQQQRFDIGNRSQQAQRIRKFSYTSSSYAPLSHGNQLRYEAVGLIVHSVHSIMVIREFPETSGVVKKRLHLGAGVGPEGCWIAVGIFASIDAEVVAVMDVFLDDYYLVTMEGSFRSFYLLSRQRLSGDSYRGRENPDTLP